MQSSLFTRILAVLLLFSFFASVDPSKAQAGDLPTLKAKKATPNTNTTDTFYLNGEIPDIGLTRIYERGFSVYDCLDAGEAEIARPGDLPPTDGGQGDYWVEIKASDYGLKAGIYCYRAWGSNNQGSSKSDNHEIFEIVCDQNGENCNLKTSSLSVRAYPSTVVDFLSLEASQAIKTVQVINSLGQTVRTFSLDSNKTKLDLSTLPAGSYFIRAFSADNQTVKHFVKI